MKSPHAFDKEVDFDPLFQGLAMQVATGAPAEGTTLNPTKKQILALRIVAYGIYTAHLEVLNSLLLGGRMPFNFLHDHWTSAVQDYLDGKPLLEVFTVQSFKDMMDLLPLGPQSVLLIDKRSNPLTGRAVTSLRFEGGKDVELPVDMYVVHEAAPDRKLPDIIRIDCAGLGDMTLVDHSHGTSVLGLTDMDRTSMDPPWRLLNLLCTILPLTVWLGGMSSC